MKRFVLCNKLQPDDSIAWISASDIPQIGDYLAVKDKKYTYQTWYKVDYVIHSWMQVDIEQHIEVHATPCDPPWGK